MEDKLEMQDALSNLLEADKRLDLIDGVTYSKLFDILLALDEEIADAEEGVQV